MRLQCKQQATDIPLVLDFGALVSGSRAEKLRGLRL